MTTEKPDQKTTALYIRTAVKNNQAIIAQKKKLVEYAQQKGNKKYKFYIDNGVSGLSTDRPALSQLMSDIGKEKIGDLAVTDISILSRNYTQMATLKKEFEKFGVSLITPEGDIALESDSIKDMLQTIRKRLDNELLDGKDHAQRK